MRAWRARSLESARGWLCSYDSGWVIQRCGAGGQTVSHRAESNHGTVVCVKCAPPDSPYLQREALMLARLDSRHAPSLIFDGSTEGFVIEEYVQAKPLKEADRPGLRSSLPAIAGALGSLLDAFTSASPVILHRDIKPGNLRLTDGRLVLLDFGSAEFEGQRDPAAGPKLRTKLGRGTHLFQAPEQLLGSAAQDRRVDVFAAASVLFAILTGRAPYRNDEDVPEAMLMSYRRAENRLPGQLAECPKRVASCLVDCLRVEPEERSSSLHSLAEAIRAEEWSPSCCVSP